MSSVNVTIGLMSAVFLPSFVIFFWLVDKATRAGMEALTGVIQGQSIPIKNRWIWLYQTWMGYSVGLTVLPVAAGMALLQIARGTTEADAAIVGYTYTFICFVGSIGALATGILMLFVYSSGLRQAKV